MSMQLVEQWPSDHICMLRLNRPDRYNALGTELVHALRSAVQRLNSSAAKVVLLAAADPGFCAGADLKERRAMSDQEKFEHNRAINALANEFAALPQPTIAVINGVALGGGCELALACDLRFATNESKLGLTEARLGAFPGAGGTQRLPRLIGAARALEMMLSGEPVSAHKALDWGLVNSLSEPQELNGHALSFATILAARSRHATALLKRIVYRGLDMSLSEGLELEGQGIAAVLASRDYAEGLTAFAERRPPNFE